MKFFLDNNLSPHLAHGLRELSKFESDVDDVIHLTDRFRRDCADTEWIDHLAEEGGWVVISQDRLKKNDLEREALRRSGLIVFCLDKGWSSHTYWNKATNLVKWWPAIVHQAGLIHGGASFRVTWKLTAARRFEQIRL